MSRHIERQEKNCLNCNTEVQGRFCHNCGQENIETKETVWHLVSHFFQDITHFDGKFFSSLKYIFTRPGFLSSEYMAGRRASYVNPVRMYVFTSAFFFLIFFSMIKVDDKTIINDVTLNGKTLVQVEAMDSLAFMDYLKILEKESGKDLAKIKRSDFKRFFDSAVIKGSISFTNTDYRSRAEYDSVLQAGNNKDGWFRRELIYKQIELNEKYNNEGGNAVKEYGNMLLHSLPQMLFILLPLFALVLKLLYIRRKTYYYVDHGIFSIHFYIFSFIMMLFIFVIERLNDNLKWPAIRYIVLAMGLGIFFYLYKAMRNFYMQRRAKTIFKLLLLCLLIFMTVMVLFLFFIFYALYKL